MSAVNEPAMTDRRPSASVGGRRSQPGPRWWRVDGEAVLLGLRMWTRRQTVAAVVIGLATAVFIGLVTVLIPNPVFGRDIPPIWWNYPVLLLMSGLTGMLAATYVRPVATLPAADDGAQYSARGGRIGAAGTVLAWFAVGCPVCNKIALLALGYTGALTFFAPLQPVLAILALVFTCLALVWRLQGLAVCPMPARPGSGGEPR